MKNILTKLKEKLKGLSKVTIAMLVTLMCVCTFGIVKATVTMDYENNKMTYQTGDTQELPIPVWGGSSEPNYLPIGGKIFYDDGDNGATYTFYNADKNEITYTDINSLDNAVYYTVDGSGSKDRFYVVASDFSKSDYDSTYGVNLGTSKYWGYYGITTSATTNTIGSGKTNTAKVLAITDTSQYASDSIWEWLNDVNSNKYGGCDDWFIGSRAEYDALRETGKAGSLFDSEYLWSSVERASSRAYLWFYDDSEWIEYSENYGLNVVAFRTLLSEGTATIQGPQKEFAGWWTKDGTGDDWGTQVTTISATDMGNMNLYAKWEVAVSPVITFYIQKQGEANPTAYQADRGMTWSEWVESDYNTDGYIIATDGNEFLALPNSNIDFHITYGGLLQGQTNSNPSSYKTSDLPITLSNPGSVSGYTFNGWYLNGTQITQIPTGLDGDIQIVANMQQEQQVTCCFDAGSQILMANGTTKNIEDVQIGDYVITLNEATNKYEPNKVTNTIIKHNSDDIVDIKLSNGVTIGMRAYHPLLTTEGYKTLRPEITKSEGYGDMELLEIGDTLIGYKENATIVSITPRAFVENYDTYNLAIENNHNYIVDGIVAHNAADPC